MCSFVRGVGCPSPLFCSGERSRRASRRAALAVSALRRTSWCTACGARGDTTRRSRAGLATLARLDSVRREITIFRASFAACFAAVWAQYLTANCSTRRSHGFFSGDGRPRSPARRLPRRAGPWRCFGAVPHRERARFATWLFGRRGPTHPSSPTPPGLRAVAQIRARNLTS